MLLEEEPALRETLDPEGLDKEPAEEDMVLLETPAERAAPALPAEREAELTVRLAAVILGAEARPAGLLADEEPAAGAAVPVRTTRPTPARDCPETAWALVAYSLLLKWRDECQPPPPYM